MNKPLIVQKFGGTSVGSIERIHVVAEHIIKAKESGNQVVVVVSAMSGETNRLLDLAYQIDKVPTARELDVLLSAGEQVSMALLAMTLNKLGYPSRSLTGAQASIVTDAQHNDATIQHIDTRVIREILAADEIAIVAGFQGINELGDITTLGRGGSDTSAVTLAGALKADECQIYTDVDGIYTCDPRVVTNAIKLPVIDFPSMEEMARKGAKVLHLPSVQYAWKHNVPLRVLSTFDINEGSLVKGHHCHQSVCGIAIQRDMYLIEFDKEYRQTILDQCHMLGITIWSESELNNMSTIVIKQDAFAKLSLVVSGETFVQCHHVSLLTAVGAEVADLQQHACDSLGNEGIKVVDITLTSQSMMFVLLPECVDKAANILHDAYITIKNALDYQHEQLLFH